MSQAKPRRHFLNFEVEEELLAMIDETAKRSNWDRSKQARALIKYALGIPNQPYIPMERAHMQEPELPFGKPSHETQVRPRKLRRTA